MMERCEDCGTMHSCYPRTARVINKKQKANCGTSWKELVCDEELHKGNSGNDHGNEYRRL